MSIDPALKQFIDEIPKAELHVHLEGTFEPELMFEIAKRNSVEIRFDSVEAIKRAYEFSNLQDFLDIYYEGAAVLLHEQDFYDLTWEYLKKLESQNVVHAELFFDPQTHTARGVKFESVISGITRAINEAKQKLAMSVELIMCFLRHESEDAALETLKQATPFRSQLLGVGLDSSELGNPPAKFKRVFEQAQKEGYRLVAHAGEEGPSDYIWEALDQLNIHRIDHGNRCLDDPRLVQHLSEQQIALTVCPLSNTKLCVVDKMENHPMRKLMDANLLVTVNSDDPAYFGGHLNENYHALAVGLGFGKVEILTLVKNSFKASFLSDSEKDKFIAQVDRFANSESDTVVPTKE